MVSFAQGVHQHVQPDGGLRYVHVALALAIMAAYIAVPFTSLRKLPVPASTRISGMLFFLTCAITHLAIAVGFHDSPWMVVSDVVQLIAVVAFIVSLSRMVAVIMARRAELTRLQAQAGLTLTDPGGRP